LSAARRASLDVDYSRSARLFDASKSRYKLNYISSKNDKGVLVSVRLTIIAEIKKVAEEQNKKLVPLSDGLVLQDFGFDSLCFAILIARLEDTLGSDPFSESDDITIPVTLGDFVRAYENAAS
jgi:acyl carrier protein